MSLCLTKGSSLTMKVFKLCFYCVIVVDYPDVDVSSVMVAVDYGPTGQLTRSNITNNVNTSSEGAQSEAEQYSAEKNQRAKVQSMYNM